MRVILFRILLAMTAFAVLATAAVAQSGKSSGNAAVKVPDTLTHESVRDLVSGLDDRQTRTLLLRRLNADADRQAAEKASRSSDNLSELFGTYVRALGVFFVDVWNKAPLIPSVTAKAIGHFLVERRDRPLYSFFLVVALSLGIGSAAAMASVRAVIKKNRILFRFDSEPLQRFVAATLRLLTQIALVIAFIIAAQLVNNIMNWTAAPDRITTGWIISVFGWCWLGIAVVRFVLSPYRPDLRVCAIEDKEAQFLARRLFMAVILFNVGFGFTSWLKHHGTPYSESWLGVWVHAALHVLLLLTIWQGRHGIAQMAAGSTDPVVLSRSWLARWWPMAAGMLVFLHWLIVELIVSTSEPPASIFAAMATTLALLIALPVFDYWLRNGVVALIPVREGDRPLLRAAQETTRKGALRVLRVIALVFLVTGLLKLWNVDITSLAAAGVGARFASSLLTILFFVGVAYGAWELVGITVNRQIAYEQVALGFDLRSEHEAEGEGGGPGARLGTLLPLVRLAAEIAIIILTCLAVLGELGVNIWPFLAGAGVVGLAIGFGAQTLVKDIISGIFFLIDDAFRKGEYIDIGSVKGTVERISLRSMQLRHHNGPLNTVPFGDIRHVTNYSRDWVVMKLSLRLTYDTDAEKVRKMIKKLGEELQKDPEHGTKFLQPLKSQGVIEMDDLAMIMRIKFMTRPGDQWAIRRIVFNRIRELFEKNNIRFASREVVVRVDSGSGTSHDGASDRSPAAIAAAAAAAGALPIDNKAATKKSSIDD